MIIFCYGMPKSASSFAYQIMRDLIETNGNSQGKLACFLGENKRVTYQHLSSVDELKYFDEKLPTDCIYLIKTHSSLTKEMALYIKKMGHLAFATYRDPLDIAISLADVGQLERSKPIHLQRAGFANINTLDQAIAKLPEIVKNAEGWLLYDFIEKISYVDINNKPSTIVERFRKMLDKSGCNVKKEVADDILIKYLENKKSNIWEFNVGGIGRWKGVMTDTQVTKVKNDFRDFRGKWIIEN